MYNSLRAIGIEDCFLEHSLAAILQAAEALNVHDMDLDWLVRERDFTKLELETGMNA